MKNLNKKKILLIFLVGVLICTSSCMIKNAESERYILPDDFQGVVLVLFDQEDGQEKEYDGEFRIYRVPESGVLKTEFSQGIGYRNIEYLRNGEKLHYLEPSDSIMESIKVIDSCFVFSGRTASGRHWFSVGQITKIDSLAAKGLELVDEY